MLAKLQKNAEELLRQNPRETPVVDTSNAQRLVRDLQVQQVELETQNEELRRVQLELGAARDGYKELYDFAPVGYLVLDDEGVIIDANFAAAALLGLEREALLESLSITRFLHPESFGIWDVHSRHMARVSGRQGVDLCLISSDKKVLTVRAECSSRGAAGQCLMALTDISERVQAEDIVRKSEQDLLSSSQQLEQLIKQRSSELLESEERFRVLFEEAPDACFLIGSDGRYINGSKAVEVQTGYCRDELIGKNMLDLMRYPGGMQGEVMERYTQLTTLGHGEKLEPLEYNLLRKDGSEVTVEISTISIGLGGETVFLSTARDLTQRNEAEAAQASLYRQCRIALDAAKMGWWHYNTETGIVSYDQPFGDIFGAPQGKCPVKELLKAIHPKDSARLLASTGAATEALVTRSYVHEYRVRQPDGSLRWVEAYAMGEFEGQGDARRIIGLSGTVSDITERKQSEEALRASEARFRSIVNNLLVGVVVHAPDTSVLLSNPQASVLLGLSAEQMLGNEPLHPDWCFINEDRSLVNVEDYPVSRVIATGKRFIYESMGIQKPGCADITWVTGSAIPVFTQDNVLDRIVVNFMDVTEIKRLQQALQKRVLALTHPLDQPDGIAFDELFNLSEMQRIQDEFSAATGVASIITDSDGVPITAPSNFLELCQCRFRGREETCEDVFTSLTLIGRHHPEGPIIQQCRSSGLWDAGATIAIGGRHIATWLIGQVRDASLGEDQMRAYAREIGADETAVTEAFAHVPIMTRAHFEGLSQSLFMLATQLSTSAYQNVQQARFIENQTRAEHALQQSEEKYHAELRKLASELSLAEQRERERVGRELHDGISQLLSSSLLRLQVLKESSLPEFAVEPLDTVCGIVRQALDETRSLTFELSCPMLEDLGLAAALAELCSSMSRDYGIHFEFRGAMARFPLSMDRGIAIYRSTRELLINVMKHSGAQRAWVHLEKADNYVRISVEDDGMGFNAAMAGEGFSPTGGFGLFSVRETIRHAGGKLEIESSQGGGTAVVIRVPLEIPDE